MNDTESGLTVVVFVLVGLTTLAGGSTYLLLEDPRSDTAVSCSVAAPSEAQVTFSTAEPGVFGRGDRMAFRACPIEADGFRFLFGVQGTDPTSEEHYALGLRPAANRLSLLKRTDRGETVLRSKETSRSLDAGSTLTVHLAWDTDGRIAVRVFDETGGVVDALSAEDRTFSNGSVAIGGQRPSESAGVTYTEDTGVDSPPAYDLVRHDVDGKEADGVRPADLDGDGLLDIVSAEGQSGANWFENDGSGRFGGERDVMTDVFEGSVEGVNAADFDCDGRRSVLALSNDDGTVLMTEATDTEASGWRPARRLVGDVYGVQKTTVDDIDGDGDLDVAFAWEGSASGRGGYGWLEYLGGDPLDASNWARHSVATVEGAWWLTGPVDVDGDGDEDLVGTARENMNADADGRLLWLEKPPDPTDPWTVHTIDDTDGFVPNNAELADFNGDGVTDVAAAMYDAGTGIYWYDPTDGFEKHTIVSTSTWYGLGAADFTGNGRSELVAIQRDVTPTGHEPDPIVVYEHLDGEWRPRRSKLFEKSDDRVSVVDLDGTGDLDVLTGSQDAGTVWWEVSNFSTSAPTEDSRVDDC